MFMVIMTPSLRGIVLGERSARSFDTGIRISTSLIIVDTLTQLGEEMQFTTELYEKAGWLGNRVKCAKRRVVEQRGKTSRLGDM